MATCFVCANWSIYREFMAWGRYEMDEGKLKGNVENIKIVSLL